jgi:hypothetical protein
MVEVRCRKLVVDAETRQDDVVVRSLDSIEDSLCEKAAWVHRRSLCSGLGEVAHALGEPGGLDITFEFRDESDLQHDFTASWPQAGSCVSLVFGKGDH